MNLPLNIAPEAVEALAAGRAVVALESTLITHGLPFPHNREAALSMEAAVRAEGAVPATIAIIDGEIIVGLSAEQIDRLAETPSEQVRKCSRRDLPITLARRETGATTVAGTMILAHMAGIRVFATGGIGGVHRGHPFDVSADLIELGRTPVAVVCAGAKSILDLPLTLEVLETQGVPVIGYGTDVLPTFYTRGSELPVDVRVDTPNEAAHMIHFAEQLGAHHGLLITAPVPVADALPDAVASAAITQALEEAEARGISGKAVTPFLLARVAEITGGDSRRANIALLLNNAHIGAQIAVALAALRVSVA